LREAAEERQRIEDKMDKGFREAAEDRARIRKEMAEGFAHAAEDRRRIEDKMDKGFEEIKQNLAEIFESLSEQIAFSFNTSFKERHLYIKETDVRLKRLESFHGEPRSFTPVA
jgi:2-hydroxy-3-keto-5-methylthiopentenyl-1-phosphate phosphatase